MADPFSHTVDSVIASSRAPFAVTPSDTVELSTIPKALYVGTGGTVVLRGADSGADVSFVNVAAGQILDVRARFVRATGTTAANIIGLA